MSPENQVTPNAYRVIVGTYCYRIADAVVKSLLPAGYTLKLLFAEESNEGIGDGYLSIPYEDQHKASVNIYWLPRLLWHTAKNKLANPCLKNVKESIQYEKEWNPKNNVIYPSMVEG